MASFEHAIKGVLYREGGYVDDPDDRGGATNFGISSASHPDVEVEDLDVEKAKGIYEGDYWKPIKGDELPQPVADALLDYAVHSGVSKAAKDLQRLVRVEPDGVVGKKTVAAVLRHNPQELAAALNTSRESFLTRLAMNNESQRKFYKGWMNRIQDVRKATE